MTTVSSDTKDNYSTQDNASQPLPTHTEQDEPTQSNESLEGEDNEVKNFIGVQLQPGGQFRFMSSEGIPPEQMIAAGQFLTIFGTHILRNMWDAQMAQKMEEARQAQEAAARVRKVAKNYPGKK